MTRVLKYFGGGAASLMQVDFRLTAYIFQLLHDITPLCSEEFFNKHEAPRPGISVWPIAKTAAAHCLLLRCLVPMWRVYTIPLLHDLQILPFLTNGRIKY